MHHKQKIVEAIKRFEKNKSDISRLQRELERSRKDKVAAEHEVIRQITNVVGTHKVVVFAGKQYEIQSGELIVQNAAIEVLEDKMPDSAK